MCEISTKNCVKFACNYFKNSTASGDFVFHTPTAVGDSRSQAPCGFYPIPNLPPPMITI